ncbi:MAG: response regulator transcription factor [Bacteroidota bacterium]
MKILIIEDEPELLDNMVRSLEKEKYIMETAGDFHAALDKIVSYDYSCILLDINLPGGSGLELLRKLKQLQKTDGVIIISARNSLDDKLAGLDMGADDYLGKPFHLAELTARVKAVLRRKAFDSLNTFRINNLVIHFDERLVSVQDQTLILNRKEYDILVYFAENQNRLISRAALAEHVWGDYMDEAGDFEFIYSQIKNLRKKLKEHAAEVEIQAVYGIGYKLIST